MASNGGIIGKEINASLTTAIGVYDTFDQYNGRLKNTWPPTLKVISITPSSPTSINEGSNFIFSVVTEGYANGSLLYYTIVSNSGSISTSDFTDSTLEGSFTINNNTGSVTKTLVLDEISEAGDSFVVQIRQSSTSGPILITSAVVTINNPTFSVTPSSSIFNEGASLTFNVTTNNIANTTLYYSLSGISNLDITSGSLSGSFSLINNSGQIIITAVDDFTTENNETIYCYIRLNSTSGPIVASSTAVTLIDTSITPTATITSSSSVNEGNLITYNVSLSPAYSGTYYWTLLLNTASASDFSASVTSGSFSVTSGSGSFSLTAIADNTTEGAENFTVQVRQFSTNGTIIGTSGTTTINDTSLTPSATITASTNSVNEGGSVNFTINTTNLPSGTLFWDVAAITGNVISSDLSPALNGTVSISSSTGSVNITISEDTFDEGAEVFVLNTRFTGQTGAIIGTSPQITINDTSTGGGSEPISLYNFETVTFGAGTTGPSGPSTAQAISAMTGTPAPSNWNSNTAYFTSTNGILLWTVPATSTYRITAAGASGQPASTSNRGALIAGDFTLVQGQKLRIVVGQIPTGTGGGGGSYVIKETGNTVSDIYIIAGGGGGKTGGAGGTATNFNSSNTVGDGNGGLANQNSYNGPAGGGFFTSGTVSSGSPRGNVGSGFLQGAAGGALTGGGSGGFGGGASGGADNIAGGGGGGGYSGGSGGGDGSNGQGAGSYPNGTNQSNTANSNSGAGYVTITKL